MRMFWGAIPFDADYIQPETSRAVLQRLGTGSEIARDGRDGVIPFVLDGAQGGMVDGLDYGSWSRDKTKVWYNEGIYGCWQPGVGVKGYATTTQATLLAADVSGYTAANNRAHSVMFNRRFNVFAGPYHWQDTSVTNPALTIEDTFTDSCTAVAVGQVNSTYAMVAAFNGATNDISYSTDGTTWTLMVALNASDYISALAYIPTIGPGVWVFIGTVAGTAGCWYCLSTDAPTITLQPLVQDDTADVEGTLATTTTAATSPARGWTEPLSGRMAGVVDADTLWDVPGNITASDNTDARSFNPAGTAAIVGDTSDWLYGSGFDFSAIPLAAIITGILVEIEAAETDTGDNAILQNVYLTFGGSRKGENRGTTTELGTVDAYVSFGSSTDRWGLDLTGADLRNTFSVAIQLGTTATTALCELIDIDHVRVTVTYRMPGKMPIFPTGGYCIGTNPKKPERLVFCTPPTNEAATVLLPRQIWFADMSWDVAGNRPLVSLANQPPPPGYYVGCGTFFQGGVAVAVGQSATSLNHVKLIDRDLNVFDLNFPGAHGLNPLVITQMEYRSTFLIVDTAETDGSEAQRWCYFDGKWYVLGVLQSKSNTIATLPLLWAESTFNEEQNRAYRLFPVSTTNLAAAREFIPPNLTSDPQVADTSELKQNGTLYLQFVELDLGAPEAKKTLLTAQHQSRLVDTTAGAGSYGTVRLLVDTGGDRTIAAAEVDVTFGTDTGQTDPLTETYNIVSSSDPGISFQTAIFRLIAANEDSTAKSPNLFPIAFEFNGQWPAMEELPFQLIVTDSVQITDIVDRIKTLQSTKSVQRLRGGGFDCPAAFVKAHIEYEPTEDARPPTRVKSATLLFRRSPGTAGANSA